MSGQKHTPIWQRSLTSLLLHGQTCITFRHWQEAEHIRKILNAYHEALEDALSFQNEDTNCLVGPAPSDPEGSEPDESCPDGRCRDHGCMVARVNRWRAAIAVAKGAQS